MQAAHSQCDPSQEIEPGVQRLQSSLAQACAQGSFAQASGAGLLFGSISRQAALPIGVRHSLRGALRTKFTSCAASCLG